MVRLNIHVPTEEDKDNEVKVDIELRRCKAEPLGLASCKKILKPTQRVFCSNPCRMAWHNEQRKHA